jgi:hypothetical protein
LQFASVDPERFTRTTTAAGASDICGEAVARRGPDAWQGPLVACWRRLAAESSPRLRGSREYDLIAYAGAVLAVVEQALIERVGDPAAGSPCEPRGSLWCTAQALDTTALLWHRLKPAAGRRYGALGASLQHHVSTARVPAASTSFAAATARTAAAALEQLAGRTRPRDAALEAFESAAVALAGMGVRLWEQCPRSGQPRRSGVFNGTLAMRWRAAEVATVAVGLVRSAPADRYGAASWLGVTLALGMPAGVGVIDDPDGDRVLRAEAFSILRAAWISRGALELLVVRAVDREATAAPAAPHRIAAVRAATRAGKLRARGINAAWRQHSLALGRTAATYMRARVAGDAREELLDLLADSLAQVSMLDVLLGREPVGGSCALGA